MFEIIAKLIETRMQTGWNASSASTVPIRWENTPWKQPATMEWVALTVIPGDGRQESLGASKLERQLGIVTVQVFTPKNTGKRRAMVLADIVGSVFRYMTVTDSGVNVIFRAPELGQVGERKEQYQTNVVIPFIGEKIFS